MPEFSSEATFMWQHWDTYQTARDWEEKLKGSVRDALRSMRPRVKEEPWWSEGWVFEDYKESGVFVSRQDWKLEGDDRYRAWIGVSDVDPSHILVGEPNPPYLYIWVATKVGVSRAASLRDVVQKADKLLGSGGLKNSLYVDYRELSTGFGQSPDDYMRYVNEESLKWIAHYAGLNTLFDQVLSEK